jgi:hypothetical protein
LNLESPHIVHLYNISKNNFKLAQKIWQLDNYDDKQDASNYNNYCNSWRKLHGIRFEDHIMEHDSPTNLSTYIVLVRKFFFFFGKIYILDSTIRCLNLKHCYTYVQGGPSYSILR